MKRYKKLLTAVVLLITSLVMVLSTSYAWMTMSSNPVTQGIQITVAGSHTVLVAPDIRVVENGQVLHYPGAFSENLHFDQYQQYQYLQDLGGLLPASTADGLTWFIPEYYTQRDEAVDRGQAFAGQIRPTWEFTADNMLHFANLSSEQTENQANGHYVYLDFWVVAPVDGYKLRVSTGDDGNGGSFVIDLLEPEQVTQDGISIYTLSKENAQAAASVRVGFLINEDTVLDNSMQHYTQSSDYNKKYHRLQGVYSEPGLSAHSFNTKFTIYEPNGNLHPTTVLDAGGNPIENGQYVITRPLGAGGIETSVKDRLTVQLTNSWMRTGEDTAINQMFRTFSAGKDFSGETVQSLQNRFYVNTLQYQLHPYVNKGNFLSSTANLYTVADSGNKIADAEELRNLMQSGATEDVYMTQLTGSVPQRIRMFIWLEGQDVDCINSAATSGFAISIELAGSNAS